MLNVYYMCTKYICIILNFTSMHGTCTVFMCERKCSPRLIQNADEWVQIHGDTPLCSVPGFSPWSNLVRKEFYQMLQTMWLMKLMIN